MINEISQDPDVCEALFEVLEIQRTVSNKIPLHVINQQFQLLLPNP
ncbi:MAG: hypothetical protein FWD11_08615 [Micrococcales bacterium]|nr:hypothetical protein [Micrococcales bacterium]